MHRSCHGNVIDGYLCTQFYSNPNEACLMRLGRRRRHTVISLTSRACLHGEEICIIFFSADSFWNIEALTGYQFFSANDLRWGFSSFRISHYFELSKVSGMQVLMFVTRENIPLVTWYHQHTPLCWLEATTCQTPWSNWAQYSAEQLPEKAPSLLAPLLRTLQDHKQGLTILHRTLQRVNGKCIQGLLKLSKIARQRTWFPLTCITPIHLHLSNISPWLSVITMLSMCPWMKLGYSFHSVQKWPQ